MEGIEALLYKGLVGGIIFAFFGTIAYGISRLLKWDRARYDRKKNKQSLDPVTSDTHVIHPAADALADDHPKDAPPKESGLKELWRIGGVVVIGILVILVVRSVGLDRGNQEAQRLTRSDDSKNPVFAFTTVQSAEGATTDDFHQNFLRLLEDRTVNMTKKKMKLIWESDNLTFSMPKLEARSVYVEDDARKFAVIKIRAENKLRAVWIVGIRGEELVRVQCQRLGDVDIRVFSGNCGAEIEKSLGWSIPVEQLTGPSAPEFRFD